MKIAKNDYQKILAKVQTEIKKTEAQIVQTVNRQKVEMCWQIGKIIEQHLLENDRADYGKKFFKQLATDTKIAQTTLYQMRSFFKAYPKLPKDEAGLNWSHYRNLSSIKNTEQRKQLEDLTKTQNLDGEELRQKISKSKPQKQKEPTKLRVNRGQLFTYTKTAEGEIDLGFNVFLSQSSVILSTAKDLKKQTQNSAHEILRFTQDDKRWFTYFATLERVVDGDTIHVKLDLGFGVKHREILRLARINAAEADTSSGKKATNALKKILKDVKFLIIKTNKTDIYGRYVADVFFDESGKEKDLSKIAAQGTYLSQLLLDKGLVEVWG